MSRKNITNLIRNARFLETIAGNNNLRDGNLKERIQAWQIHSYGDINELQMGATRKPIIRKPNELLVKVDAAALNPIDYMMMQGYAKTVASFFRRYEMEFPMTLGRDFSGVVVDKGQDVKAFKVGDEVYGVMPFHKQGSHAEVIVADEYLTSKKPAHLEPVEAASILYSALTAWSALYFSGELCVRHVKNTRVLIIGASGGVGTLAVQMLKAQKAIVVATCAADSHEMVRSLGADAVFDYSDIGFNANVIKSGPYDVVLDCAKFGAHNVPTEWKYQRYVTLDSPLVKNTDNYGLVAGFAVSAKDLLLANVPRCANGSTVRWGFFTPISRGMKFIDNLVKTKQIQPVIHKVFQFDEMPEAFEMLKDGHLRGKIVIDFH